VIRLAGRLTAGGGREAVIRLVLTGAGMALAVTMLLCGAVGLPALHAHDVRGAWTHTSAHNKRPAQDESTTDPLLWDLTIDHFGGRDLVRVEVAPLGPRAPLPPGLTRLPGPGELAVSPALRRLLDRTPADQLADRFPGRITATVGRAALPSPDDLVVFVGRSPGALADRHDRYDRHTQDGETRHVVTVRSIESNPVSHPLTTEMRGVLVIGGLGLLLPVVVFVATATRLAAARREQRLAAMRLAGATQHQVGVVAAVEAVIAAAAGTLAGLAAFLALRPSLARIPLDGASFYPADLHLSPLWAVLIVVGVPALAVAAALVSLRRIRISPLGVTRQERPRRASPEPLLLVVAGVVGLIAVVQWSSSRHVGENVLIVATTTPFVVMMLGIVLSGPWLTTVVARQVARVGRRPASLLAARRLQDNPAAGFRAISGVILAVFVGTVFSGLAASLMADEYGRGATLPAGVVSSIPESPELGDEHPPPKDPPGRQRVVAQHGSQPGHAAAEGVQPSGAAPGGPVRWKVLDPARTANLVARLRGIDGVRGVVTAHALPDNFHMTPYPSRGGGNGNTMILSSSVVAVSCEGAAALGVPGCRGTTVLDVGNYKGPVPTGIDPGLSPAQLVRLPVVAVAAVTDGTPGAIERARTALERGIPGPPAGTARDINKETQGQLRTMQRMANIGLSVTLVIAGCSLAVAVAGGIVERKRPFALLRLAGTQLSDLRRVVLAEAAAPLLAVTGATVGLGFTVAYLVLKSLGGDNRTFIMPGGGYWLGLVGGLAAALGVVMATLPLLARLTSLDSARFE
jgi:hypothetical protein